MISHELLGLNVEIAPEYVYKANPNQERKLLKVEMPPSPGRDMHPDSVRSCTINISCCTTSTSFQNVIK